MCAGAPRRQAAATASGDDRHDEQEAGVPVDEEPAGERGDPGVPDVPGRDRRRGDQEDAEHDHVEVRHPVRVDRGRVHGAEHRDDRDARGRAAHRPGPAVDDQDGQRQHRAVEHEHGQQVRVPRRRHHVQGGQEEPLPEGLRVHVGRSGMAEAFPGVVPDQQREVHRLLDPDGVRGGVALLVEPLGEQEPVAHQQHREQDRERRGPDPPGPAPGAGRGGGGGRDGRPGGPGRRLAVAADAHDGFPGMSGSRFRFHSSTVQGPTW